MRFLAPAWLALLLLAAPIVWLHMRRPRRAQVSSLLLWQGVGAAQRLSPALRKPPLSAALLLQLLAVVLAAAVLARPALGRSEAEHLIILLDAGSNQDEARFADATKAARRLIAGAATKGEATWSLLLVSDRPRPLAVHWPTDRTSLADIGPALTASAGTADWARAALLARSLAEGKDTHGRGGPARVVIIGATADALEEVRVLLPAAEVVPVAGGSTETFAWVSAKPDEAAGQVRVSGAVMGHPVLARQSETVRLAVSFQSQPDGSARSADVDVTLSESAEGSMVGAFDLTVAVESGGILSLTLAEKTASFVLHDRSVSVRVLYMGPGNEPLLRALEALPQVMLERLPVTAELPDDVSDFHLVILDRVSVAKAPSTSTWWLGSARVSSEGELERLQHEAVTLWAEDGLAAEVDWSAINIGAAWVAPHLPGATTLVTGENGPLVQLRRSAAGVELRSSFELAASDWPLKNSFPLFVRNLVWMLEPAAAQVVEAPCQVGFDCPLPAGTVSVLEPNGAEVAVARWDYTDATVIAGAFTPERAGVHVLIDGRGEQRPLAVNAFQALPELPLDVTRAGVGDGNAPFDLRRFLLLALAAVIVTEALLAARPGGAYRAPLLVARATVVVFLGLAALELRLPLPAHSGQLVIVQPYSEPLEAADDPATSLDASFVRTDPTFTDLEAALDLAAALVVGRTPARLVVAGDGSQTRGELASAAGRLASRGLTFDALPLESSSELDVVVRSVSVPDLVLAGDRFELNAVVYATARTTATVTVFRAGELLQERQVILEPGANRVSEELTAQLAGEIRYEIEVRAPGDTTLANDHHGVQLSVAPAAPVLLVTHDLQWAQVLAAALGAQGTQVITVTASAFPTSLEELRPYGAVILMNVPAVELSSAQQLLLEVAVQEQGLPLLLLGGENAFGPGGYYQTPLERLSPTSSLVPREAPELAIAFVLDRSNSMRQYAGDAARLDIAKVAAVNSHALLPEGARSALIVFDSNARTLVPLGPASDDAAFRAAIEALEPRGGTNLYPALVEAYEQLADAGAAASHVIVMSDGLSLPGDFAGILSLLRAKDITVSTIAIGPEADADQLREVAQLGGGIFHASVDFGSLPSIMAHEVLLQSGELTEERDTAPIWHDRRAALLRAWPDELPPVSGFVPTSLKPGATLHLSVTDEQGETLPLLSSWHHGAGEVVAFSAHGAGPWTSDWLARDEYPLMWSHLVRQMVRPPDTGQPRLKLQRSGDVLTVSSSRAELVLDHESGSRPMSAHEVSPGRYVASTVLDRVGWYQVTSSSTDSAADGNDASSVFAAALQVPYPAVLDRGLADPGKLAAAALASGGQVLTDRGEVAQVARWHWPRSPAWPYLTLAALVLLLLELTSRYAPGLLAFRSKFTRRAVGRPVGIRKDGP